jgi:hypothetical protein
MAAAAGCLSRRDRRERGYCLSNIKLPADGGYSLQLSASSSLYDVQRSTGLVDFDQIGVTMPLGDPVASPPVAQKHKKKHRKRKHRH